jgi:DNA-binding beta-propeller fold protein YncE
MFTERSVMKMNTGRNGILATFFVLSMFALSAMVLTSSAASGSIGLVTSIKVGNNPSQMVYDPANKFVYVSNWGFGGRGSISVISSSTDKVVATIVNNMGPPSGMGPYGITYDPANKQVYVASYYTVAVIKGTKLVANIALPNSPAYFVAYDPANQEVFVNGGSGGVFAINSATNAVTSISLPQATLGLAYDPANKLMFAGQFCNGNTASSAYAINSTNALVATIPLPSCPAGISSPQSQNINVLAYDPANHNMFIGGSSITVVNSATVVIKTIVVNANGGFVYNPSNREMYALGTGGVTPISHRNVALSTIANSGSYAAAFDSTNKAIYVSTGGNSVSVINSTTNTISTSVSVSPGPISILYDPSNTMIYAVNYGTGGTPGTAGNTVSVISS